MFTRIFLVFAALLAGSSAGLAQDLPLLVLRLQAEQGYVLDDRKAGLSGAVYALSRNLEGTPQSLQIAYNARNRPTLIRLVQKVTGPQDIFPMTKAALEIASLGQPDWTEAETVLTRDVEPALAQFAEAGATDPLSLPLPDGTPGSVSFIAGDGLAVMDLPVRAREAMLLDEPAVQALATDSSFLFPAEDERIHHRYHAPNGRLGGGSQTGDTSESGSWSVEANGRYCIETAPVPGFRCAALYQIGDNQYLSVPIVNDVPDGRGMRRFEVQFGNPGSHVTPKRDDATPAAVTRMIVVGQTEERRRPEGGVDRIFLDHDGAFRGQWNDRPVSGRWTVMNDGRRCLTEVSGAVECAFLSETDGGTFRLYDSLDRFLGEAMYQDGNPGGL